MSLEFEFKQSPDPDDFGRITTLSVFDGDTPRPVARARFVTGNSSRQVSVGLRTMAHQIHKDIVAKDASGLDGWRKNLAEFKVEWEILKNDPGFQAAWKRVKRKWWSPHERINLEVEAGRTGCEYLIGHVNYAIKMILKLILALTIAALIAF